MGKFTLKVNNGDHLAFTFSGSDYIVFEPDEISFSGETDSNGVFHSYTNYIFNDVYYLQVSWQVKEQYSSERVLSYSLNITSDTIGNISTGGNFFSINALGNNIGVPSCICSFDIVDNSELTLQYPI